VYPKAGRLTMKMQLRLAKVPQKQTTILEYEVE
jgi:hypothetical protein